MSKSVYNLEHQNSHLPSKITVALEKISEAFRIMLWEEAKKYKTEPTDMVQVAIRGKITNEKHDKILWPNKVEVVEILNVKPGSKEEKNIIKLGNQ